LKRERRFDRPQIFSLNADVVVNQGFCVFWRW